MRSTCVIQPLSACALSSGNTGELAGLNTGRVGISACSIHGTIKYRRLKNIFPSILGSFGNRRIENNDYEMVIHGFLSIIIQLLRKEIIRAQNISDRYIFTA